MADESAVALRTMGPRANLSGDGNSLDNIITNKLADGATCWITSENTSYRFVRASLAIADGFAVVAPIAGPGRWFREDSPTVEQSAGEIAFGTTDGVPFVFTQVAGAPTQVNLAGIALNPDSSPDFISPSPGVLRYVGERSKRVRVSYSFTFIWQAATGGVTNILFLASLALNGTMSFIGKALVGDVLQLADNNTFAHSADVMLTLNPGDELTLLIAGFADETYTLLVFAVDIFANEV